MPYRNEALLVGKISHVPVKVGPVATKISCHAVGTMPHDLFVGRISMKIMKDSFDNTKSSAKFRLQEDITRVPLSV